LSGLLATVAALEPAPSSGAPALLVPEGAIFSDDFESAECASWSASTNPLGAPDGDTDSFGDETQPTVYCELPDGFEPNTLDCDDGDDAIHPGAAELCNAVDDDCDDELDEGFDRDGDPSCAAQQIYLGSIAGDLGAGELSHLHYGERWLRFRLTEMFDGVAPLGALVRLFSPTGVDFDLYLYCAACPGAGPVSSSTVHGLGGHFDMVYPRWGDDFGFDDGYDVIVEIRHVDSNVCAHWTFEVFGNADLDDFPDTCNP
jgi:hypothetical protein